MNRLKTDSAVFLICRFSPFLRDPFFPDYLEVATAVVVPHGVCKTSHCTLNIDYINVRGEVLPILLVLIFFHILFLQKYWVLTESRIRLKPVLGGVRIVAHSNNSYGQTQ